MSKSPRHRYPSKPRVEERSAPSGISLEGSSPGRGSRMQGFPRKAATGTGFG
jgi:hypothetical protein